MRVLGTVTRSDTTDSLSRSFSEDNGRTWCEPETLHFMKKTPQGIRRTYPQPVFPDPVRDLQLTMVLEGTLPTDDPLEGLKHWHLRYRVSRDGGRTHFVDEQVIEKGFTPDHPCEGVWLGKNSMMIGDQTCRPLRTKRGRILVPVQVAPVGPDGEYHNPGGGYTYHDSAVLIGRWTAKGRIRWELSEYVRANPARSTRGVLEPTLAEMPDGRILMVMRGSNDARPELPGYKWYSISEDGGYTWGSPEPWGYTDGSELLSPSSCSQLLEHTNGNHYWIGNVTEANPRGNSPRYPLVMAQVDAETCRPKRETLFVIDDRKPGEDERMTLSNFMAHEDRETGEIVLHMSRLFARRYLDWTADAYIYRIRV